MIGRTFFLFLIFIVIALNPIRFSYSQDFFSQEIVGVNDSWAPFAMQGKDEGMAVDIVTEAFKTQGYNFKFKLMPWARAIHEVRKSRVDILVATWFTEERAEYLQFSQPYFYNQIRFIKLKGDPFEYFGMASLTGKKIGIVRSYGYGDDFLHSNVFQREPVVDVLSNLKKLISGRIDLTLGEPLVTQYLLTKEGMEQDDFEFSEGPFSEKSLHISVSKDHPDAEKILRTFNLGLKEIKTNGVYLKILLRYKFDD